MKRDWRLIKQILRYIEEKADDKEPISIEDFYNYEANQVRYHVRLCVEAGFIVVLDSSRELHINNILRLTWTGHNKLDELQGITPG